MQSTQQLITLSQEYISVTLYAALTTLSIVTSAISTCIIGYLMSYGTCDLLMTVEIPLPSG